MSTIRPFTALRPLPANVDRVSAVPYDVVNAEEARELAGDNPLSFLHVSRAEIDLPPAPIRTATQVYDRRARELRAAAARGAARGRGRAGALLLPPADGRPRADGRRRLLLGRRIRSRPDQEARADAARQGRRPHAAHQHAPRADRSGVPHLSRLRAVDAIARRGDDGPRRSSTSPRRTACATRSGA